MAHAKIKTTVTPEWVQAQEGCASGIISVGGLVHRVENLESSGAGTADTLLLRSPAFRASIRAARCRRAAGKGIPLAEARRRLKA